MLKILNPTQFMKIVDSSIIWLIMLMVGFISYGLYLAIFASPPDYQQGESVRIMYVHVPSAWMALGVYSVMASSSAVFLIWQTPLADTIARCSAKIGANFAFITLVTGSLWGKPIWGTWWAWDARLTSMLILFFFYLGYIAISNANYENRSSKAPAILAIVGFINVPIIKFSVDFWNTLHQPSSILRLGAPTIHSSMLTPLIFMILGFLLYYLVILAYKVRADIFERKIARAQAFMTN